MKAKIGSKLTEHLRNMEAKIGRNPTEHVWNEEAKIDARQKRNVESEHDRTEPYMTKHNQPSMVRQSRAWPNMTEQNVTLVCVAYRRVAWQPATLYAQSFSRSLFRSIFRPLSLHDYLVSKF